MIKFMLIFIICCRSFLEKPSTSAHDLRTLQLAMIATCAADFNMLITENIFAGICLFCVVQFIYCYRYAGIGHCFVLLMFLILCGPSLILLISFTEPLFIISGVYAVCFGFSLYAAVQGFLRKKYPYPNNHFVVWGMVLFALCDINVALGYFGFQPSFALIWLFYLPGQFLLSSSAGKLFEHEQFFTL